MDTVVASLHPPARDLGELEALLGEAGARDPRITGYTVVLTSDSDSRRHAVRAAGEALDRVGGTSIEITRRDTAQTAVRGS